MGANWHKAPLIFPCNPDKLSSCDWDRPNCDVNSIEEKNK